MLLFGDLDEIGDIEKEKVNDKSSNWKIKHNITERKRIIRMNEAHERLFNCLTTHFGVEDGKMTKEKIIKVATDIIEVIALERMMKKT